MTNNSITILKAIVLFFGFYLLWGCICEEHEEVIPFIPTPLPYIVSSQITNRGIEVVFSESMDSRSVSVGQSLFIDSSPRYIPGGVSWSSDTTIFNYRFDDIVVGSDNLCYNFYQITGKGDLIKSNRGLFLDGDRDGLEMGDYIFIDSIPQFSLPSLNTIFVTKNELDISVSIFFSSFIEELSPQATEGFSIICDSQQLPIEISRSTSFLQIRIDKSAISNTCDGGINPDRSDKFYELRLEILNDNPVVSACEEKIVDWDQDGTPGGQFTPYDFSFWF